MHRPWIVPVGGFLGAGKTTLILAAARVLNNLGRKPAAILNDQGSSLVDTAFAEASGILADEVTGACFCCRFSDLVSAADRLRALEPEVIFIEPVGSCTDLAATLLRPLQRDFLDRYQIAPLTVLVDPGQARTQTGDHADPNICYLFQHQLAEADIVAINKCDLYPNPPEIPGQRVRTLSAATGFAVPAWLDEVLSGTVAAGSANLKIDYREYAAAEAALAWLNWSATVRSDQPISPAQLIGPFFDDLQMQLTNAHATIAHIKLLARTNGSYLKAALTGNHSDPVLEGDLTASPARSHSLRVNVRAVLAPEELECIFRRALEYLPGSWDTEQWQCFSPAEPRPEHRIS